MQKKNLNSSPNYSVHKATSQAYILVNGRRIYLGKHGSPGTLEKYHRLCAEIAANGGVLPISPHDITVTELCSRYWLHAKEYYRKADGTLTSEITRIKSVTTALNALYGATLAIDFGPNRLRTLRQSWVDGGLSRSVINAYVGIVKRIFRWAVAHQMLPGGIDHALRALEPLRHGRSAAKEGNVVHPVPEEHIDAVIPFVSGQVAGLIRLQLLTAARPSELLNLCPDDIETSGPVWVATIRDHKLAWRKKDRHLFIGPKGQAILRPFMLRPPSEYLFSPCEAEKQRRQDAPTHRRPDQSPSPRKTARAVGDRYDAHSYARAIARACKATGIPSWSPYRLRHNAATRLRSEFGIETARIILGHANLSTTEIYAEEDARVAQDVIARIG